MALQTSAAARQQPKAITEPITDFRCAHRQHPRGREFDGECDSVESGADLRYLVDVVEVECEVAVDGASAFDEQ